MVSSLEVRAPEESELGDVLVLAARVTDELYGPLSPALHDALARDPAAVLGGADYWRSAVIGFAEGRVVAVCRTEGDQVTDLWLEPAWRRQGLGSRLLADAEDAIRSAGHRQARLNVMRDNVPAVGLYRRAGWKTSGGYRNQKWGIEMLRMAKHLP